VTHRFHRLFSTESLIKAVCNSCYKEVAVYERDTECPGCQTSGGRWSPEGRCRCGPPALPQGSELARWITRARRVGPRRPITVRVPCGNPAPR
jgi:hypothetical protein